MKRRFAVLALVVLTAGFLPQPSGAYHQDTGGYTAVDSTQTGGPAYEFIDITETGTSLALADDDAEVVPLPFAFEFFGQDHTEAWISSNGLLSFTGQLPTNGGGQQYFPDPVPPNGLLAGYWADLDPSVGGVVAYETLGEAPNRTFVVMYKDVPHWRVQPASLIATEHASFEIVLHEGTTRAVVHFSHVAPQDEDVTIFRRDYVSGLEDHEGYRGLVYDSGEFVREEIAVAFEETEASPPPPPPPPLPPITTTYDAPFTAAGADHTEATGNLPGRHARASSTSDVGGRITLKGSADSLNPTAGAFPARADSTGWIRLAHDFAETTVGATVSVRVRLESLSMRASAVADPDGAPLGEPSTFAEIGATLRNDQGECAYPQYYAYPSPTPPGFLFGGCEAIIASISPPFPLGERSMLLQAPKEIVLTYDLGYLGETSALWLNLHGLAFADGVRGAASLHAAASVLEISITEFGYGCSDPEPCPIVIGTTEPL